MVFFLLRGLGILVSVTAMIQFIVRHIGGDAMNGWMFFVCALIIFSIILCAIILVFVYSNKKLDKEYEHKKNVNQIITKLNNKIIDRNLTDSCKLIPYDTNTSTSAAPQKNQILDNTNDNIQIITELFYDLLNMINKKE